MYFQVALCKYRCFSKHASFEEILNIHRKLIVFTYWFPVMLSVFHLRHNLGMLPVNIHVHIIYIEICGNLSFEVGVVKKISLNSEKLRAYKRLKYATQPYILTFEKNCGAYELSILG